MRISKLLVTLIMFTNVCFAQVKQADWMIDASSYVSKVEKSSDNKNLKITNGLIERTILLEDVGTTIGFKNLSTQEEILRSVRPEAEVTIDKITIPVGGMKGQPIHNYLLPAWLEKMTKDKDAIPFVGYTIQNIGKRFDWKPRREWMATDPSWPPRGKEIILSYQATDELINTLALRFSSDANRKLILNDNFISLSSDWSVKASKSNTPNLFVNEGKAGEILVQANTAIYAERDADNKTEVVRVKINPGTDHSSTWGPGIAWVFDKKTVRVNLRTADNKFCILGTGLDFEWMKEGLKKGVAVDLRIQRTAEVLACSYSYDDGNSWVHLYDVPLPSDAVSLKIRIGKMDKGSTNGEISEKGEFGRCRIENVVLMGGLENKSQSNNFAYLKDVKINVHYEIYDGIPAICKWISVENKSGKTITINDYKSEILAAKEVENDPHFGYRFTSPNISVETDFEHAAKYNPNYPERQAMYVNHAGWEIDPLYKTQIDWSLRNPCLLISKPQYGPNEDVTNGSRFESHRTWELIHDTWERERKSLQLRKMYRTIAPWIAENPIFMHVRSADNASVKKAIDQCAQVGFEMVIMTFWSGVEIENPAPENLSRMKELADYAHSKNIALGGYSLLSSRSEGKENNVVMPEGYEPTFGTAPCLESKWGIQYFENLYKYYRTTGQDILEHDGSYPGDECASEDHPGHKGLADSQWKQFKKIQTFYHWCKSQGIFLNIPDWFFINGGNKTGMGYRETNWSLPREQQEVLERQNIYDGTWRKTPSMGWMMVPLVEYHGGGAAATIEPLKDHLDHYNMRLANNFGAGVMACYRGPQLYDTPQTEKVVKNWVDFYKTNRRILNGDVIHLRRPDGVDWDGLLHVDPQGETKGLAVLYNPLNTAISRTIKLPLYYTGLQNEALISVGDKKAVKYKINRDFSVQLLVEIPARGYTKIIVK